MEEIIRKIISIEGKAQEVIEKTHHEVEVKHQVAKEQLEQLEEMILNDARRKIAELREKEFAENELIQKEKTDICNAQIKKMEVKALENEAKWVEDLYQLVLER